MNSAFVFQGLLCSAVDFIFQQISCEPKGPELLDVHSILPFKLTVGAEEHAGVGAQVICTPQNK